MARSVSIGLGICLLALVASARGADKDLLNYVPEGTNAIAIVDVQGLHKSPLGQKEGWEAKHKEKFMSGEMSIPVSASTVVTASHIDPHTRQNDWRAGVYRLENKVSMDRVAKFEKNPLETIAGQPAVMTRRNGYIFDIDAHTIGVLNPASRQNLSRWIHGFKRPAPPPLSDYLSGVFQDINPTSQMVLAIDLEDAIDQRIVRQFLSVAKSLEGGKVGGKAINLDNLSELIAGVKGATFIIHVSDKLSGELRIDFAKSVGPNTDAVRKLVPEMLREIGASIEELDNADYSTSAAAAIYRFDMTRETFRLMLSLLEPPNVEGMEAGAETPPALPPQPQPNQPQPNQPQPNQPQQSPQAIASQKYFKSIATILKDLKRQDKSAVTVGQSALWYDQFAKKIDNLPLLNVDPDLMQFGGNVSANLRVISQSMRGATIQKGVLEREKSESFQYNPGGYSTGWTGLSYQPSSWEYSNNFQQVRLAQQQAIAGSSKDRVAIWNDIDNAMAGIRRQMVSRYSAEF